MKNNIIFKYQLKDAWGMELTSLEITNEKENNIHIKEYEKDETSYTTINPSIIENMISKYSKELPNCKEFPHAFVNDGYYNLFYFKDIGEIEINNLCYLEPTDKNVKLILDIYKEIYDTLSHIIGNKIKKSFVLSI